MEWLILTAIATVLGLPALRLLGLYRHTGRPPEGLLALFFLGLATGIPCALVAISQRESGYAYALRVSALLLQTGGMAALAFFGARVFRPASSTARLLAWSSIAVYALGIAILFASGQVRSHMHWTTHVMTLWALATVAWAFVECCAAHGRMRRQARAGLGDPVVRNRFLLWCVWTGAIVLLPVASLTVKAYLAAITPAGEAVQASPSVMAFMRGLVACAGSAAGGAIWLSFFPPERYLAWLRGSAGAPEAG